MESHKMQLQTENDQPQRVTDEGAIAAIIEAQTAGPAVPLVTDVPPPPLLPPAVEPEPEAPHPGPVCPTSGKAVVAQSVPIVKKELGPKEVTDTQHSRKHYDELRRSAFEEFKAKLRPADRVLIVGNNIRHEVVDTHKAVGIEGLVYGIQYTPEGATEPAVPVLPAETQIFPWNELFPLINTWVDRMAQGALAKFDAVFIPFALAIFDGPHALDFLKQCHKAMKADGQMVVMSVVKENDPAETLGAMFRWLGRRPAPFYRPVDARALLTKAGFRLHTVTHIYPVFPALPVQTFTACPEEGPHHAHHVQIGRATAITTATSSMPTTGVAARTTA